MAIARRSRRTEVNIWPAFVDALGQLVIAIIFLLLIFTVAQFLTTDALSGRDQALQRLTQQINELTDLLNLEKRSNEDLRLNVTQLSSELQGSSAAKDALTTRVAELAADKRVNVIDACMTAVPSAVRQGGLTFLVGGQKAFFERAKPHLLKMAKDAVHMGPLGCGNVSKLFKNMVTASEALIVYEALQIAKAGGVSYKAALDPLTSSDPAVTRDNPNANCRGNSRFGEWLAEFRTFVADREAGRPDAMPALTVMRFPNDHTTGLKNGFPTPQFMVADNDYAVGRLVEAVSSGPYWKDTAIFLVEDDAQAGPDHVDSHRSVGLAISAYNRPGALIHKFHSTVSMIRTIELLLGIAPMNQLDASAIPMDIFQETPDLTPYKVVLPAIAADNLITQKSKNKAAAEWMKKSNRQNFAHADMADPNVLNAVIWFACTGNGSNIPQAAQLPAYQAMRLGIAKPDNDETRGSKKDDDD